MTRSQLLMHTLKLFMWVWSLYKMHIIFSTSAHVVAYVNPHDHTHMNLKTISLSKFIKK